MHTLERDKKEYEEKLAYYESLPTEERKNKDTRSLKDKINCLRKEIEEEKSWINHNNEVGKLMTNKEENNSDLVKENQDLRQQLTEVQKQLAEVLKELKKLKSNINGKGSEKLNQQIAHNEKLIKNNENVSVAEIREQVNKSQALMNELNTNASINQDDKGNGSLPYVIGGSVILAVAGIIGYFLVKRNKRK